MSNTVGGKIDMPITIGTLAGTKADHLPRIGTKVSLSRFILDIKTKSY